MYDLRAEYLAGDLDDDTFYDWSNLPTEDMINDWAIHNDHAYDSYDYETVFPEPDNDLYDW